MEALVLAVCILLYIGWTRRKTLRVDFRGVADDAAAAAVRVVQQHLASLLVVGDSARPPGPVSRGTAPVQSGQVPERLEDSSGTLEV